MDYLKELGVTEEEIKQLRKVISKSVEEKLLLFPRIVIEDYEILKSLGIKNHKQIFLEHTHMFSMNPDKLRALFNKYDQKDLIRCLEKNGAVIEKLT